MRDDEKYLDEFLKDIPFESPSAKHRDQLSQQLMSVFPKHRLQQTAPAVNIWRTIMRNRIMKLAVAAVIIFAVLIGLNMFNGTVTFADVVEPILNARIVVFDLVIGDSQTSPTTHEIVSPSRIRRTLSNMPNMSMVVDLDKSKMLMLDSKANTASYVDTQGSLQQMTQNYARFLRDVITRLQNGAQIESLGKKQIEGWDLIGFSTSGPNEKITIWADPETRLPVRIELTVGQMNSVMKNFEFDPQIDESLFSMEVPAGYTLQEAALDLSDVSEQDFIESLRIWAEILLDGEFPENIGTEYAMQQMPLLASKLSQLDMSEQQATQTAMAFARGMLFQQVINARGNWHYAGKAVELGDADKAILWYKLRESDSWRVIYGDLSVQELEAKDLPN